MKFQGSKFRTDEKKYQQNVWLDWELHHNKSWKSEVESQKRMGMSYVDNKMT